MARTIMSCRLTYVFFSFFLLLAVLRSLFVLLYSKTTERSIGSLRQGKILEEEEKETKVLFFD